LRDRKRTVYPFCYSVSFVICLLTAGLISPCPAFSEPAPLANNVADDNRVYKNSFSEEQRAAKSLIENVNDARKELAMGQPALAKQKIIMAQNLLPIIARVTPAQSRLTRVEFGGGLYADDLGQRKSYSPIETYALETLTRGGGPRWVKNTRSESDAKIIYISFNLNDGMAHDYLKKAEEYIDTKQLKDAELQLAEMSDRVIRIDNNVPTAVQARDYIALADNYISAGNFFGARSCLVKTNDLLQKMKTEDAYKAYRSDIISLHADIEAMEDGFAKLDAEQIESASGNLAKWGGLLSTWANE
jgi:hypothetical protein